MEEARQHSALTLSEDHHGHQRQAGRATRRCGWIAGAAGAIAGACLWAFAGWTAGAAFGAVLFAAVLAGMTLHILDHISDFLA